MECGTHSEEWCVVASVALDISYSAILVCLSSQVHCGRRRHPVAVARRFAQKLSAGVVGGASLTDGFQNLTILGFVLSPDPGSPPVFLGTRFWSLEGLFGIKPEPSLDSPSEPVLRGDRETDKHPRL